MDEKESQVIQVRYNFLLKNLLAARLCPYLVETRVINLDENEKILAQQTKTEQARELLQYVIRSQVKGTFRIFCDALHENDCDFIESELLATLDSLQDGACDAPDNVANGTHDTSWLCKDDCVTTVDEVPQPVSYFCKRQPLLDEIHNHLDKNGFVVLAGIRGAGKTQLARYLVHSLSTRSSECLSAHSGVRMEIYSRVVSSLHRGLEYMTQMLNVNDLNTQNDKEKSIESALKKTLEYLRCLPPGCSKYHFLLFDDVTIETCRLLSSNTLKGILKSCSNIRIILTTNNINLYYKDRVIVNGLSKEESLDLFKRDYDYCKDSDDDIIELCEHLSYLPLGLSVAKQVVRKRHQSVRSYLKQLISPSISKKLQMIEAQVFVENEYDKGLMSALTISIEEIRGSLDPKLFHLYELTTLSSHIKFPLYRLKLLMTWSEDEEEKEFELGNLVEAITDSGVGTIRDQGRHVMLDTHRVVQLAVRLQWSQSQLHDNISQLLLFLSGLCIKDTRFNDAFKVQMTLLPHAEAVLLHATDFQRSTIDVQVAEIRLLEAIGYMYTQLSMLDKAQYYLLRARDMFIQYFLNNNNDLFSASDDIQNSAQKIIQILGEKANKVDREKFVQFVLQRAQLCTDRDLWRSELRKKDVNLDVDSLFRRTNLKKEDFSLLQKHGFALDEQRFSQIFLPELLITTLYSLGRIYFFKSSKGEQIKNEDISIFKSSLFLANELCKFIHDTYNIRLMHLLLSRHYGLVYLMMEKHNKVREQHVQDLLEAKENYETAIKDNNIYFQAGLLKKGSNEEYNEAVCLRQLLRCHVMLLRHDNRDTWQQHKEQGIHYMHRLEEILEKNKNSFGGAGFLLNIAKFCAQIALAERMPEYFDKAVSLYCQCCDMERSQGFVKYPWLLALKGLSYLVLNCGEEKHALLAREKVEDFLGALQGRSTTFPFEWKKACIMKTKLFRFVRMRSIDSHRSSCDFLNSSQDELDGLDLLASPRSPLEDQLSEQIHEICVI